jgi:uncharacterized protein YndB with AHSA1/START domain
VSVEHDRFELQRTYPAPPERVFARWADPALKAGWFSAPGAEYEFDFRVGGHEVNRDGTPGGAGFTYIARYCDIVPNERIVYTYELYAGEALASVSPTSVMFLADGDGTLLTVTEQIALLDGRDTRAARKRGVTTLLERLGEALD